MIFISMHTADLDGAVILPDGESTLGKRTARVSRSATLDGGSVIDNLGRSHGDRTFEIISRVDAGRRTKIEHIFEQADEISISCSEGFFYGVIDSINTSNPKIKIKILISVKVA